MKRNETVVAVYDSHQAAEAAVKELQQAGFDMRRLSIIGTDYQTEEKVVGGAGALVAALVGLGVPEHEALQYEVELKAGKFLLLAHGTAPEVERARELLHHPVGA